MTTREVYVAIYGCMMEEAGGRGPLEKVLDEWAMQHELAVGTDNGSMSWDQADSVARNLLGGSR